MLADHRLKGNDPKTDILFISFRYRVRPEISCINVEEIFKEPSSHMTNIGVTFYMSFSYEKEVNNKDQESYYHINNLGNVCKYHIQVVTETMVHAFISTTINYANALLVGLPKCVINKLQYVKYSAVCIVTCKCKYEHITTVFKKLHWLPVCKQIIFKVLLLTFKCKNRIGPKYLSNFLFSYDSGHLLRLEASGLLRVPLTMLLWRLGIFQGCYNSVDVYSCLNSKQYLHQKL